MTSVLDFAFMQIASDTHIIIDENTMQTGILKETGLRNFKFLANFVQNQQITFDFDYFE